MNETATIAPVRKDVFVPCAPDRAFEVFTAGIGTWWPLPTHSVGDDAATGVSMEAGPGGRIVETIRESEDSVWGTVTAWDPPDRVAFTWHPGHDPEPHTEVEVRFVAEGAGTRVELTHRGWERLAEGGRVRESYHSGWDPVLARYVAVLA